MTHRHRARRLLAFATLVAAVIGGCQKSKPFARDRVIEQVHASYPDAALPGDELPAGVEAHEDIVYARRGTTELALDLYERCGSALCPGVIVVHGGGWQSGDRTMERPLAKRLAARGYAAATVGYRLGDAGRFPAAFEDIRDAVRFLRESAARFSIDPHAIGAVGGSAGGQLVALLGAASGRLENDAASVQAVVDIDGLADFTGPALLDKEKRDPGGPTRFLGGPYAERADVWREASAITHVGPASAPTLFLNSTAPTPILPGRSEMCAKLGALGIDCAVVVVPGTPHPFWLVEPWFDVTVDHVDAFLRRHLCPSSKD